MEWYVCFIRASLTLTNPILSDYNVSQLIPINAALEILPQGTGSTTIYVCVHTLYVHTKLIGSLLKLCMHVVCRSL